MALKPFEARKPLNGYYGIWCMRGSRGGAGGPDPHHKNIGFLSSTDPDPLKNHKRTKPVFNLWPSLACQRNAI